GRAGAASVPESVTANMQGLAATPVTPATAARTYNANQRLGRRSSVSKKVRKMRVTVQTVSAAIVHASTVAIHVSRVAPASRETRPGICDQRTGGASGAPSGPHRAFEFRTIVPVVAFVSAARAWVQSDVCR